MWLLQRLTWVDIIDILLVSGLLFGLFYTLKGTRAIPLVRGIMALLVILTILTRFIPLRAFSWLVEQLLPALLVAVPVLFQPELRRALEQLGRGWLVFKAMPDSESMEPTIEAVVEAAEHMARHNIGALIVFERQTGLQEYIETGVELNAEISSELLSTIFDHHTILHDGAVIISDSRLVSAACVLPLTSAILADRELGLRHRAALGVTEESDAICVVISEERGAISLTHSGRIIRDLDKKRLNSILHAFLLPRERSSNLDIFHRLFKDRSTSKDRGK
ncbi:MAG: TIGR00159 family protein [Chloroflexi bacterium]|nr:TIGR00159 family protein [Chloroflexota bacterium]